MLNASEIALLEKKVFFYRLKKHAKSYGLFLVFFSLIGVGYFFYDASLLSKETKIAPEQNSSTPVALEELNTTEVLKEVPASNSTKSQSTLVLRVPELASLKPEAKVTPIVTPPLPKEETVELSSQPPRTPTQETGESKIDMAVLAPPELSNEKPKGIIKIETKEVNSIQYLKDKFEKTHNSVFALMLSEEYYIVKNYEQSHKWALIANQLDAESEKSWILFAKSKVKLGKKEDAIKALQAYLKHNKSKAAQSLLNQITLGEFNE